METRLRLTGSMQPRSGWTATRCTIARALDVVSTRSAFLILREAFYGTSHFGDFAERVGISEPVAAAVDEAVRVVLDLATRSGPGRQERAAGQGAAGAKRYVMVTPIQPERAAHNPTLL